MDPAFFDISKVHPPLSLALYLSYLFLTNTHTNTYSLSLALSYYVSLFLFLPCARPCVRSRLMTATAASRDQTSPATREHCCHFFHLWPLTCGRIICLRVPWPGQVEALIGAAPTVEEVVLLTSWAGDPASLGQVHFELFHTPIVPLDRFRLSLLPG